jgi:hypothetical protein
MVRNEYILDLGYAGRFRVSSFSEAKEVARRRTGASRIVAYDANQWRISNETQFKQAMGANRKHDRSFPGWDVGYGYEVNFYTSQSENAEFVGQVRHIG